MGRSIQGAARSDVALPGAHQIRKVTIDLAGFTAIFPAIDCNKVVISRGREYDGFLVRTDPNDPLTEEPIAPGQSYEMIANTGNFTTAFEEHRAVCYVKSEGVVGTLIVKSTR